jgi:hypothetical protein
MQRLDQIHVLLGFAEAREKIVLFQFLVIFLDEVPDDPRR